nr:MAG TPA: chromosome segregation protein [Bacteriophage sp.]
MSRKKNAEEFVAQQLAKPSTSGGTERYNEAKQFVANTLDRAAVSKLKSMDDAYAEQLRARSQPSTDAQYSAGSTPQVNQRINDYLGQLKSYKDALLLQDEKSQLENENKWLSSKDPLWKQNSTRISQIDTLLKGSQVEKPKRPLLEPKKYANQDATGTKENSETIKLRTDAAKLLQQSEKERKYWEDAQKRYQPDSRDFADAKARWERFTEQYQALGSQLPGGVPEISATDFSSPLARAKAAYAAAEDAFKAAENDYYNVPDGDFDGVEARYLEAEKNLEAAKKQMDDAAKQTKKEATKADSTGEAQNAAEEEKQQKIEEAYLAFTQAQQQLENAQNNMANSTGEDITQYSAAYDLAKKNYDAAKAAYYNLKNDADASERNGLIAAQEDKVQRYETYRYMDGFQEDAEAGMEKGLDERDDPVSRYLANKTEYDAQAALSGTSISRYNWLADNELKMYYFLLNRYGLGEAKQYLSDLEVTLDKRISDFKNYNTEITYGTSGAIGKTVMNAATVPANIFGGVSSAAADVSSAITGKFNPYSAGHELSDYANTVRGITAQEIVDSIDSPFWGAVAANTYQAVMSGADSALGATLFGNGYTWIMGSSAASQRAQELYEKGASGTQIGLGAIASGLIEEATEKYSVEYFTSQFLEGNVTGFRDWAKKTLIQALNEGSEEVASDIANLITDALLEGKNSDYRNNIQALVEHGMSREEAQKQAFINQAIDTFWSFYGGAVSGGLMGGAGGIVNATTSDARKIGKDMVDSGSYDEILKNAVELGSKNKDVPKLQSKAEKGNLGKRGSDYAKLTNIYQENIAALTKQDVSNLTEAIAAQAEQLGAKKNPGLIASGIVKKLTGEKLTMSERYAMAQNQEITDTLLNDISRAGSKSDGSDWVRNIGTYTLAPEIFGTRETETEKSAKAAVHDQLSEAAESIFGKEHAFAIEQMYYPGQSRGRYVEEMAKAYKAGQEGIDIADIEGISSLTVGQVDLAYNLGKQSVDGSSFDYDGEAEGQSYLISDSSPVNISEIASAGGGGMVLLTDEGKQVNAQDVKFGSYGTARLFKAIETIGVDAQAGNTILEASKNSQLSNSNFAVAVLDAYNAGRNGVAMNAIGRDSNAMRLDEATRQTAWEAGRDSRRAKNRQKQQTIDRGEHAAQKGSLTVKDSAKNIESLNAQQKSGMDAARLLSEMGVNITVYASTEKERNAGMENGSIYLEDGSIWVDLNAGADGQGVMAFALSHEFTHFVEEFSPEKFHRFTEILFEAVGTDVNVNELIAAKAAALKRQGYKELSAEELNDLAYSEVVAEMMETALTDTDVMERISARLQQTDMSLWEKIKKFLQGLVERLKEAYRGLNPDSSIAQLARNTIRSNEEALNAFADAASDAVVNYQLQDGEKNNAPEGERYSVRTSFANELQKWFDTTTHDERKVSGKRFLVGTTTDVLKSIGVRDYQIYFGGSKIDKILEKNSSMNLDTIKRAVNLLEAPILIMQSRTVDDSIVLFGDVYTSGGKPVMLSLLLNPKNKSGEILDYAVITSAYGRRTNNLQNLLDSSQIYFVNEDKNRTDGWLQALGLQLPSAVTKLGSIGKIADLNGNVNSLSDQTETDSFKKWFGDWQNDPAHASKVVNADGTPKVVYHQTDADFTIFDPRHEGAGTRDSDTPFGIFLKSSDKNIGLQGSKQMALYADIKNPLTVENREQLINELQKLSDGYAQALVEHQMLDAEYKRKSDNAIKEMREYMVQWRKDNPGASGRALYDDNRFMQLFDAEDNITDEWESKAREIELRSKEAITKDLEKHGYDGVIIQLDKGSWGRSTDAYIALRPKQVKSATDNIGTFDKNNPDIRFSRRISAEERVDGKKAVEQALSDYRYQRDAEAKAMKAVYEAEREQIATAHQREMNKLEDSYTGKIAAMSKEIIRLLRKYGEQDNSLEKIKEELSKTEEDAAIWQREFKRLLREYDTSGRNIDRLEKKVQAQQNTAKAKVETAKKTEERFKLERVLTDLNRRLLNPTKTLYVPDSLQPALTMAMQSIATIKQQDAQETASRVIARYGAQLERLGKDPVKNAQAIAETEAKLQNVLERRNATVQNALERLQQAYTDLAEVNKGVFTQEYNKEILEFISDAKNAIGDTFYGDLSTQQLQAVRRAYTAILNTVRNANKLHGENLKQGWAETAKQAMAEFQKQPDKTPALGKLKKTMEKLSWNNEKPYYAFERMGSGVMMQLYENLRNGEDGWYRDFAKARAIMLGCMDKYHFDQWENNLVEVEMADGEKVALDLQERMSLFAASKREQYLKHLTEGGFILTGSKRNGKDYTDYSSHVLALETVIQIRNGQVLGLTAEQIAFANEMQEYLSTVCAEQNNEVSRALYGVSKAKEKDYWPIKSSAIRSERVRDSQESPGNRQKNAGHMKTTDKNASNAVELRGFMETWANHVNDTAMYHNFALPMEDFYRVYNYNTSGDGIRQQMLRKHGEASVDYVDTFLKDVNGGVRADNRETVYNMFLSGFKKAAVSASLSVAIQQPSAVGRAFTIIDAKYFVGSKVDSAGGISATWEEMKKYAPVVGLKEIGRFDTDMGRSTQELLSGENGNGFMAAVDKFGGWMPEQMDKITWVAMWEAAKRQTKAEHPGLNGEALKTEAGKLFTKCITQTQVYDSVFSRSGNMRSKSVYMKMLTSFMAEPTTTINMMGSAVQDIQGKNFKTAGKKISSVAAALILNSLLASLVYAARDDDEEKTYLEKYLSSLASELVDGVNPITYYPGFKDVWSIVQGYDVERNDMSLVSDMYNATKKATDSWKKFLETDPEDEEAKKENLGKFGIASLDAAAGLLNMGGIPLKNILRELRGVKNTYETVSTPRASDSYTKGKAIWDGIQENIPAIFRGTNGKTERLYHAIVTGSQAEQERLKTTYSTEQKYESAIVTALADQDSRIRQAAKEKAAGNAKAAERILAEIEAEGNFSRKQIQSAFEKQLKKVPGGSKESVKEQYLNGEIDRTAAIKQLNGVLGMRKGDAEEQVTQWNSVRDTGIEYDEIRDSYLNNSLTESKAAQMLVRYGGKSEDAAKKTVREWGCKKDLDVNYSEVKEAFIDGEITEQQLKNALVRYGGKDAEEAEETVNAYRWQKQHPDSDLSSEQVLAYTKKLDELGKSIEETGIQPNVFADYRSRRTECTGVDADGDGKTDSGSKKKEILALIDSLPISDSQKDTLYYDNGYAASGLKKAPWHKR